MAHELAGHGFETIPTRHTCAHRVDEPLAVYAPPEGVPPETAEGKTCLERYIAFFESSLVFAYWNGLARNQGGMLCIGAAKQPSRQMRPLACGYISRSITPLPPQPITQLRLAIDLSS